MKVPELFKEYIWLVNTIRREKKISLADINDLWLKTEMSEGVNLPRTTFNRHKDAIGDIFGIVISCDTKDGYKYYIENENVLKENTIQRWMLSALTTSNIVSEGLALNDRIVMEAVEADTDRLPTLMDAVRGNRKIRIEYSNFNSDTMEVFEGAPYALKLYMQRWYVVVKDDEDGYLYVLSLDRILKLEVLKETFVMDTEFSAKEFFKYSFGVRVVPGEPPSRVILKVHEAQREYLRTLPLHPSQTEVEYQRDYSIFELEVVPTIELTMKILSMGFLVEVLAPQDLRETIAEEAEALWEVYRRVES